MDEPQETDGAPETGGAPVTDRRQRDAGLVEPEGVNAGSARTEEEPREEAAGKVGDARGGGDAERRPESPEDEDRHQDDLAGAPGASPQDPSQAAAPPGQDSGSAR